MWWSPLNFVCQKWVWLVDDVVHNLPMDALKNISNLWERLLLSFIAVALLALFFSPMSIRSITSWVNFTGNMLASGTAKPLCWERFDIPSVCKSRKSCKKILNKENKVKGNPCKESMEHIQFKKKDISFENHQMITDLALVHYISQLFELQSHRLWSLIYFQKCWRGHLELGN